MVFLDFFIRQIHEVDEDNLDVRSAIQFNDSIDIFCSRDCFYIVPHFQKHNFFLFFESGNYVKATRRLSRTSKPIETLRGCFTVGKKKKYQKIDD